MNKKERAEIGGMTHQEIADVLGITKQAVQQIQQNALRKIEFLCKKSGIDSDYIYEVFSNGKA